MRFHSEHCPICDTKTLFLEKLKKPNDGYCIEMEDVCQKCNTQFYVKEDKRIKL